MIAVSVSKRIEIMMIDLDNNYSKLRKYWLKKNIASHLQDFGWLYLTGSEDPNLAAKPALSDRSL